MGREKIRTSSLLRTAAANLDRRLVRHDIDHVSYQFALVGLQGTEYSFATLAKAIPDHFNGIHIPSLLVSANVLEHTQRSTVACFVARPLRLAETDATTTGTHKAFARGHRKCYNRIVARRLDMQAVRQ